MRPRTLGVCCALLLAAACAAVPALAASKPRSPHDLATGQIVGTAIDATTGAAPVLYTVPPVLEIELYTAGPNDGSPKLATAVYAPISGTTYTVSGIPPGRYLVLFSGSVLPLTTFYDTQSWYPDARDPGHATWVTVTAGQTTYLDTELLYPEGGYILARVLNHRGRVVDPRVTPMTAYVWLREPDGSLYKVNMIQGMGADGGPIVLAGRWMVTVITASHGYRTFTTTSAVVRGGTDYPLTRIRVHLPARLPATNPRQLHARYSDGTLVVSGRFKEREKLHVELVLQGGHQGPVNLRTFDETGGQLNARVTIPQRDKPLGADTLQVIAIHQQGLSGASLRITLPIER